MFSSELVYLVFKKAYIMFHRLVFCAVIAYFLSHLSLESAAKHDVSLTES